MPHIAAADAPVFRLPGTTFIGMAAPSRGSAENAVWRVTLDPGTPARPHRLTREEVIVAASGSAVASLDGMEILLNAGDTLVIPAFVDFSLANTSELPFEAIAVLPVGARVVMNGQEPFVPPWSI